MAITSPEHAHLVPPLPVDARIMARESAVRRQASLPSRASRFTAAALLPACLVSAVLVAAPFAGTTTHPLAADSRPVAAAPANVTAADTAPATVGSTDATTAGAPGASATAHANDVAGLEQGINLSVPKSSVRSLVVAYLLITMLGAGVIIAAAVRSARRGSS